MDPERIEADRLTRAVDGKWVARRERSGGRGIVDFYHEETSDRARFSIIQERSRNQHLPRG
nr:hypothetical protein [Methylobacterium planeticum]